MNCEKCEHLHTEQGWTGKYYWCDRRMGEGHINYLGDQKNKMCSSDTTGASLFDDPFAEKAGAE